VKIKYPKFWQTDEKPEAKNHFRKKDASPNERMEQVSNEEFQFERSLRKNA
jgi:hypothetical protein